MKPLPKAFQGLDWEGWRFAGGLSPLMKRAFKDEEGATHIIIIAPGGFFDIYNVDGEIAWSATFPSVEKARRAAMALIEEMGE